MLRHFSLDSYFDDVQGNELGGRPDDKVELVRELMTRRGLRADLSLMIGDRLHDVRAARGNVIQSVGVTYGYGSEAELREAGADHVVDSSSAVAELIKQL